VFLKDAALKVGHADDARLAPGVTAILFDGPVAGVSDHVWSLDEVAALAN
jgi:hypothetical protein